MAEVVRDYLIKAGGHAANRAKFTDDDLLLNRLNAGNRFDKSVAAGEFATALAIETFEQEEAANIQI